MPLWPQFCGGAYEARSATIDAEACINLYFETIASQENAKHSALLGTPALKLVTAASDLGCRGAYSIEGRTFRVIGTTLFEGTQVLISRGTIANDGKPVSMVSNGRGGEQLMIVGGGEVKILTLTTNALSAAIPLPLTNAPVMGDFVDGYFLLTEANTIRIWFSALENGASWSALNFFSRSHVADNVIGLKVLKNHVLVFGSLTSEMYYDSGDPTTPFVPFLGSVLEIGAVGPWAITVQESVEMVTWVGQNSQGYACVYGTAAGGAPQVLSTPAVDFALSSYPTRADAEAAAFTQEGHPCSAFTFPTGDRTWVFDHRESKWHQRLSYDATTDLFHRWRARGICATATAILAGDYASGSTYTLDLDTFTDFCGPIKRLRRAPYVTAENQWLFLDQFELGTQLGTGSSVNLRVSRDYAQTWSVATSGRESRGHAVWTRLGRAASDKLVVEASQTAAVRTVWGPGAWLRAMPGTGQL